MIAVVMTRGDFGICGGNKPCLELLVFVVKVDIFQIYLETSFFTYFRLTVVLWFSDLVRL